MLQEPKHVQPQLFRQAWQGGSRLCFKSRQHHNPDCNTSVVASKTVISNVRRCSPPPPQLECARRLRIWRYPHGPWQVCKLVVSSKWSCELLDDVVWCPQPCNDSSSQRTPRINVRIAIFSAISHTTCWLDDQCCHRTASCKSMLAYGGDRG